MKKFVLISVVLLIFVVLVAYPAAALETFILTFDSPGLYEGETVESGLTIAGESLYPLTNFLTVGYGVEIPLHTIKAPATFGFVPVFGTLKVSPFSAKFPLDFSVRMGYSFLTGDHAYADTAILTGGTYYGWGLGYYLEIDTTEGSFTKLELLQSYSSGTRASGGPPQELEYSRLSLLITYGYQSI